MKKTSRNETPWNEHLFDDGIEWTAARQRRPMPDRLQQLRAYDATLIEVIKP